MKTNKKESILTAIMLVQQLDNKYWEQWDDKTAIDIAIEGNCRPLLEAVTKRLNNNNIIVQEAYGIIHDKDEQTTWDETSQEHITKTKPKHIHFLFKFEKGASLQKIAVSIGMEPQYLERLKSGRYAFDNCLSYLIHSKDEAKFQYLPESVETLLGEPYQSIYDRQIEVWNRGKATKKAKETNLSVDWLIEKILSGEVTKNNIMLTNEFYSIYGQHKRRINEALETATERKSYQAINDIEAKKFKKTVIYITAESGVGKTKLTKKLIKLFKKLALARNEHWEYCVTASSNAFDQYSGQEILFLDDIRGESLSVSDWLKLLDPFMISPISARYQNKFGSAKVILITNTKKPYEFFRNAKDNKNEDTGQFIRRFDLQIHMVEDESNKIHYLFSKPEKNDTLNNTHSFLKYSFKFGLPVEKSKRELWGEIAQILQSNMKWEQPKKVSLDTDQSNQEDTNTKQK